MEQDDEPEDTMAEVKGARRKTDRRVLRTRKAIMNAFDKLVSNNEIDKITVSAIAREADIDRKTFYLHYNSVNDLANKKTAEGLERALSVLSAEGAGKPRAERVHIVLREVNAILTENITVYANIASRVSTDQVLERIEHVGGSVLANVGLDPEVTNDHEVFMRLHFYIAGAISLYSTWLKSSRSQPIETISNAIEQAIQASDDSMFPAVETR